jgi:hypothetical protein
MHKDKDVQDVVGIEIQVLDAVVPEHSFEELTVGSASPRSMNRANIGMSSRFFSIGYGSLVAVHHRSISFSRRNLLLTRVSGPSIFSFAFFHSLAELGRGVEGGDDGRRLRLHCGSSSSMHRSWSSLLGISSSSK